MANVWFIGDGHFGHKNILNFRKGFKTVEEHDNTIIDAINAVATKRDKIFFMGDWVFDEGALEQIKRINCPHKHLLLGNHDDYRLIHRMLEVFDTVSGDIKYKEFWLSHIPIHPDELRGKRNIYAHTHNFKISDVRKYFCTSCEQINYRPVSLLGIRQHFEYQDILERRKKNLADFKEMWCGESDV